VAPLAEKTDRDNQFPNQLWRKFGDMGLLGITAPEEFGGLGKSYLDHVVAMEEVRSLWGRRGSWKGDELTLYSIAQISRCSGSIALSYGAHSNLCVNQVRRSERRRT
jgi:isovaleryl-CoA dehydrogenase